MDGGDNLITTFLSQVVILLSFAIFSYNRLLGNSHYTLNALPVQGYAKILTYSSLWAHVNFI